MQELADCIEAGEPFLLNTTTEVMVRLELNPYLESTRSKTFDEVFYLKCET